MVWPIFFRCFIADGFVITKGSKSDVHMEYWIATLNSLVKSIIIDKFNYGSKVEYMDLVIFKGNRFHQEGLFDIKNFQNSIPLSRKKVIIKNTPSKLCGE